MIFTKVPKERIFSRVQPFYEQAVSELDPLEIYALTCIGR